MPESPSFLEIYKNAADGIGQAMQSAHTKTPNSNKGLLLFPGEPKVYTSTESLIISVVPRLDWKFAVQTRQYEDPLNQYSYIVAPAIINCDVPFEFHGYGIGRSMYEAFEQALINGGYHGYIFAQSVVDNDAQMFWMKMGFRYYDRTTNEYQISNAFPITMFKVI